MSRLYNMIQRADTIGVFQIESRAQMSMLPRLKPKEFYDLVIEVAIVRPGPIQGNMVHPYLRRKEGWSSRYPSSYPVRHKYELEKILCKNPGRAAVPGTGHADRHRWRGFHAGEADQLRRAMATFKRVGTIDTFHEEFLEGMSRERLSTQSSPTIAGSRSKVSASTAFPKAMPRAFAILVYASAWIKCHYPDVFAAALLNSQPMGFYATVAACARRAGARRRGATSRCESFRTGIARWRPAPLGAL